MIINEFIKSHQQLKQEAREKCIKALTKYIDAEILDNLHNMSVVSPFRIFRNEKVAATFCSTQKLDRGMFKEIMNELYENGYAYRNNEEIALTTRFVNILKSANAFTQERNS